MRLLIVDDHEVVREGLAAALSSDPRFELIAAAASGEEALSVARKSQPAVVIVDMRLPDLPGHLLCRALRDVLPDVQVVVLSSYLTEQSVRDAIQAGAIAYVTKAAGLPELRSALDEVWDSAGRPATRPTVTQIVRRLENLVADRSDTRAPTPQQARVLELVAQGLTYSAIADRLLISESTVRFHIQKLKLKFDTQSKTELVARALRSGLIAAPDEEPQQ